MARSLSFLNDVNIASLARLVSLHFRERSVDVALVEVSSCLFAREAQGDNKCSQSKESYSSESALTVWPPVRESWAIVDTEQEDRGNREDDEAEERDIIAEFGVTDETGGDEIVSTRRAFEEQVEVGGTIASLASLAF